ncbi:unnamed protein product [Lupinus luteus]|uniref:Protein kinase domain-containing protein n=1 Tax=Lupinus luteus TaxID=3873 RepID=A0AAV1W6C4_LUPLU
MYSNPVDDKLYIYLEYVFGGSMYKLLQEYGEFSEPVIRNYTQQILSGLAYLHAPQGLFGNLGRLEFGFCDGLCHVEVLEMRV